MKKRKTTRRLLACLYEIIRTNEVLDNKLVTAFELVKKLLVSERNFDFVKSIISENLNEYFIKNLSSNRIQNTLLFILLKITTYDPNQIKQLVELNVLKALISLFSSDSILTCNKSVLLLTKIFNYDKKFVEKAIQSGIYNGINDRAK